METKIKLPVGLPNEEIDEKAYDQGLDEELLENSKMGGCFICSICLSIPGRPCTIPGCGHLFCESCIETYVGTAGGATAFRVVTSGKCPNCKRQFDINQVRSFEHFHEWEQSVYKSLILRCPLKCPFKGNPLEIDKHQTYECPNRPVRCPNPVCPMKMTYQKMDAEHYPNCEHLRIYCAGCNLPVLKSTLSTHDCLSRMGLAVKGMPSRY